MRGCYCPRLQAATFASDYLPVCDEPFSSPHATVNASRTQLGTAVKARGSKWLGFEERKTTSWRFAGIGRARQTSARRASLRPSGDPFCSFSSLTLLFFLWVVGRFLWATRPRGLRRRHRKVTTAAKASATAQVKVSRGSASKSAGEKVRGGWDDNNVTSYGWQMSG